MTDIYSIYNQAAAILIHYGLQQDSHHNELRASINISKRLDGAYYIITYSDIKVEGFMLNNVLRTFKAEAEKYALQIVKG